MPNTALYFPFSATPTYKAPSTRHKTQCTNVVGFSSSTTAGGYNYTFVTPTFVHVGDANNFKLSDLKLEPEEDDSIQMFTFEGELGDVLNYMTGIVDGKFQTGWFLNAETYITDYDFPRGSSFWMCMASELDMTQSGEVATSEKEFTLPGNYYYAQIGNPYPVPVKLSDLEFSDLNEDDSIQMFTAEGELGDVLNYMTGIVDGKFQTGWFLNAETYVPDYEFPAGQAFWTCMVVEGTLKFPALEFSK